MRIHSQSVEMNGRPVLLPPAVAGADYKEDHIEETKPPTYMIRLRIPELAKERGMKTFQAELAKAGITPKVLQKYLHGPVTTIVQKDIEILCLFFRCMPNDLFEVVPDHPATADLKQPIYELKPRGTFDALKEMKNMTPEEIKKMFESNGKNNGHGEKKDKMEEKKKE
jgi:putative transcriptional regulator